MSVRKPLEKEKISELDIDLLIDKGAKVREDLKDKKKWVIVNLRLLSNMLQDIDQSVSERVGIKRTGWILEAISEKLKRERS